MDKKTAQIQAMISTRSVIFGILCLLALNLIFLSGCIGNPKASNGESIALTKTYQDPDSGISIRYPSDWVVRDDLRSKVQDEVGTKTAVLAIIVAPATNPHMDMNIISVDVPLTDIGNTVYLAGMMVNGSRILDYSKISVTGTEGTRTAYIEPDGTAYLQVDLIKNGKEYVLTFGTDDRSFSSNEDIFDAMAASFQAP